MNREPVVIIGTVATAIVAVLQAIGGDVLPEGMSEQLVIIIQAVVVVVGILLARSKVSPVSPLDRLE